MGTRESHAGTSAALEPMEGRVLLTTLLTVTTDADDGPGSLRQIIITANNTPGADDIRFALAQGHRKIAPLSALPDVTGPVTIDGTTSDSNGLPAIEITGGAATGRAAIDGLTVKGGSSVIKGLVINGFSGSGINCNGAGGNRFEDNYIGTDASGSGTVPNRFHGIALGGDGEGNQVGGPTAAQRNVISGNGLAGVYVATKNSVVRGNYIGVDRTGFVKVGNFTGVFVDTAAVGTVVGGSRADGSGNVISGNTLTGVLVRADRVTVAGNVIGLDVRGDFDAEGIANGDGVSTDGASFTVVGGTAAASTNLIGRNGRGVYLHGGASSLVQNNSIRRNTESGVCIDGGAGHHVTRNSIDENGKLGIDLWPGGTNRMDLRGLMTPNTPGGPHVGPDDPNNLQNFPTLDSAETDGYATRIAGKLNSAPKANFVLEFYASPSPTAGHVEGRVFLGSVTVTTDANGDAEFAAVVSDAPSSEFEYLSATATAVADGSTSEFAPGVQVAAAPPPVVVAGGFQYQAFPHRVTFTFTQRVSGSIDAKDVVVRNVATGAQFSPVALSYDPATETALFELPRTLADGDYEATLTSAGVANAAGVGLAGDATVRFFELRGDANRDRKVDFNDLVVLAQNYNTAGGRALATGDFDGDGNVNFNDLVVLAQRYNTSLRPAGAAAASPVSAGKSLLQSSTRADKREVFSVRAVARPTPVKVRPVAKPKVLGRNR